MTVEQFLGGVALVEGLTCAGVAVLLASRLRRTPSHPTSAALAVFGLVALVIAAGQLPVDERPTGLAALVVDVQVVLLLAISWALTRLAWALGALADRWQRLSTGALLVEAVLTLALPPLPPPGDPRPGWVVAYTAFVLLVFSAQSVTAGVALWRAGSGQPSVVRHRMRLLGSGAVVLAVALVLVGTAGQAPAVQVGVALVGLVSIMLFALAFLLPGWLRLVLRQADLAVLGEGERRLMTAVHRQDVADTIVPLLAQVFGGGGAGLFDLDRVPLRTQGWDADGLALVVGLLEGRPAEPALQELRPGKLAVRLQGGWLVVRAGRLAPVFGHDETSLLTRVGTLVDLALQRVELFEQEQASRVTAEVAQAELETLLYSVSHDLRSPLISVLGYLDVLRQEHAAELQGEGPHYLERISVNALYMQSLISDLLELSRIGRNDGAPRTLDLQALAEVVLQGAQLAHPHATLRTEGALPVLRVNEVRARQLLTNLVDNALTHGGRADVAVTVAARELPVGTELTVADDGRGIPEEYRGRVLEVFERLDAPKSTPGTGMGLAICKRIVESLGGTLAVEGPSGGRTSGTTIRVVLPKDDTARATVAVPMQREDVATVAAARDHRTGA